MYNWRHHVYLEAAATLLAPPSGPLLGSWLTPTTGALPKATPRTAGGRLLRRSVEMLREPHGLSYRDPI